MEPRTVIYLFVYGRKMLLFLCVFQLSKPATLNANVQPAVLPDDNTPPLLYDTCTVSGWGVTQVYSPYLSPVLHAVDVTILPFCRYYYYWMITSNMLCAGSRLGGKDSCQVQIIIILFKLMHVFHALCSGCLC